MGGVVDAVGGIFGVEGGDSVNELQFSPQNVNSPLGSFSNQSAQAQTELSPELQGLFGQLLGDSGQGLSNTPQASSLMGNDATQQQAIQQILGMGNQFQQQGQGLLGRAQNQLDIASDPQSALAFQQQVFGDQLEQQRLGQESRLLNQGLLGSTTGSLQREALAKGQNQALMEGARSQQQQAFQQGAGLLGQALQNQQLGMSAFGQGAGMDLQNQQFQANLQQQGQNQALQQLQAALGVGQAPMGNAQLGMQIGQGNLQASEGTAGLRQKADENQANFFSSLVSAGATAAAGGS